MSSDLATLFTGCAFEIEIYPFSFAEFSAYFRSKNNQELFEAYLKEGGLFPLHDEFWKISIHKQWRIQALIVGDIVAKHKIRGKAFFGKLVDFLMDKVGNMTSIRNISNELTFHREVDPFLKIKDAYPKLLLARILHNPYSYGGIQIVDIADVLLQEENECF
ncbi:MAG: hypothetical protein M0P13_11575 [Fibrobacteraceae bacterium]|nr:hypothetical protein [Fibrobacteraceae bacterium]